MLQTTEHSDIQIQNLGYKPDTDPFEDFIRSSGGDVRIVNLVLNNNYYTYMEERKKDKELLADGHILSQEERESLVISEEDFNEMKHFYMKTKNEYLQSLNNNFGTVPLRYIPPYKKILNGNFNFDPEKSNLVDKSALNETAKKALKVDGLMQSQYDIYYDQEYQKYTTIYYDYKTKNSSFLAFSFYLEELGKKLKIKLNPYVPLILFDRTLLGVDSDASLTPQLQHLMYQETVINPFFFFREAARVFDKTTGKWVRYQINIASYTFLWLYTQCFNTFRAQSRQTGKTFDMTAAGAYEWAIACKKSTSMVLHFDATAAGKNRAAMVDVANNLPSFLKFHTISKRKKQGKEFWDNGSDVTAAFKSPMTVNDYFGNVLKSSAVGTNESTASRVGRGDTLKFIWGDEINYIPNISLVLTAVQFAHGQARRMAEIAGERYGIHFASTAGRLSNDTGREMYTMINDKMCRFIPKLFEYDYDELKKYLQKKSEKNFFVIQYEYDELGLDQAWFDDQIPLASTPEAFRQDVLNEWLAVNDKSIFREEQLMRVRKIMKHQLTGTYMFQRFFEITFYPTHTEQLFEELIQNCNALSIGMDVSFGSSGDYTVLTIVNLETARRVAMFRDNQLNTYDMGILLRAFLRFLKKLKPSLNICLNIEVDGPGQSIIPMITSEPDLEKMLYRSLEFYDKKRSDVLIKATSKQLSNETYIQYGTLMKKHRTLLYGTLLFELIDKYPYALADQELYNELLTLKKSSTGRIDHTPGRHDDTIVSTLHAYAVIFMDKFRTELERYFKFVIDYSKIEHMPIASSIVSYLELDGHNDVEGKVNWTLISKYDELDRYWYDVLEGTTVTNGTIHKLTQEEIEMHLNTDKRLANHPKIKNMRLRRFNLAKTRTVSIEPIETLAALENLDYNKVLPAVKNVKEKKNITGNDLSRNNTRDSNYYNKIANDYDASLV